MKYEMPPPPGRFPPTPPTAKRSFLASWIWMACVSVASLAFIGWTAYIDAVGHNTLALGVVCVSLAATIMTTSVWAFSVFTLMRSWNKYRKVYYEIRAALDEREKEGG